jgi:predicted component of type VI protein secretion system
MSRTVVGATWAILMSITLSGTLSGCGSSDEDSTNKQIVRVSVMDSPFAPKELEATTS